LDGNQVGVANPGLAPLGNYGGPNQTIAEYLGSPAEGAGSVAIDGGQTTDGRGAGFPRLNNGSIDIGAYEIQPVASTKVVKSVSVGWGTVGVEPLQIPSNGINQLPAGRKNDLPWYGIDMLEVSFTQPVVLTAADETLEDARGIHYGPVTITGMGTSYTVMFAQPIDKADRVTLSISIPQTDTFTGRLNVLPGDVNDYGVVNSKDITTIRDEWKGTHGAQPTIFGDILGNGTVNAADYDAARKFEGIRLPKLAKTGGKPPKGVLVRALARQHDDLNPRHHG
jgi:Dockerin type I domain